MATTYTLNRQDSTYIHYLVTESSYLQGPYGETLRKQSQGVIERFTADRFRREVSQLENYLNNSKNMGLINQQVASLALASWLDLWAISGRTMPVPDACPGPDGQILFTWDEGDHHLELEIFPESTSEFFYRNRSTDELWGEEYELHLPFSPSALNKLSLFA